MSMSKSFRCALADVVTIYRVLVAACRTGVRNQGVPMSQKFETFKAKVEQYPCPVCGNHQLEWGLVDRDYGYLRYRRRGESSLPLISRKCMECQHVQLFANPSRNGSSLGSILAAIAMILSMVLCQLLGPILLPMLKDFLMRLTGS
jgi:hypothetical protein